MIETSCCCALDELYSVVVSLMVEAVELSLAAMRYRVFAVHDMAVGSS